ncbi:MAG: NUMOD3 domain-containing DNA-binding protein [Minisyncoccota bacterium]
MKQVIYKIINLTNGKFYVGSTVNQRERFRTHRNKLRGNRHHCKHLQAAWNKYGEDNFLFTIVETVSPECNLQHAEDIWLQKHVGTEQCYNSGMRSDAPWRGGKKENHPRFAHEKTKAERASISATLKLVYRNIENHPRYRAKLSDESKAKISENRKGKAAGSDHYRFGQTVSEEVRKKIGDKQRGVKKAPRVLTTEGHAKIMAAVAAGHYASFKGKHHTDETKERMSKRVLEVTTGKEFSSLTAALECYALKMPTLRRALLSGRPLQKGPCAGLQFKYV